MSKLQPALRRLAAAFETALQLRDTRDRELLRREAKELIGDFNATLKECREILENNRGIVKDGAGFVQNVMWGQSTQKKVDEQRTRIQFHVQKIEFFMESVRLEQSNARDGDIQEILAHTRELRGLSLNTSLEPIPEWLGSRFREALKINPPVSYTDIDNFPLEHGYEALYLHYKQSTVISLPTGDQTMEQYLDLLKAHWIVETLKRGAPYKALRPGSYYLRTIARLERLISDQYARPGLTTFSEEDLSKLNESSFLIWPVQKAATPRQLTEPSGLEEKILEISLPELPTVQKEDLVVFQRGPMTLRLARNIVPAVGPLRQESEKINTHIDRFIPLYAVPPSKSGSPPLAIKICDGKETGGTVYELKSEGDIFSLQRAVTGYEVVSDIKNVEWSLNRKKMRFLSKGLGNIDRVQMWYWKPLSAGKSLQDGSRKRQDSGTASLQCRSSVSSQGSNSTNATVAKVVNGENESICTTTQSDSGETVVAVRTQPQPVLFIFSKTEGGYALLHIECKHGQPQPKPTSTLTLNPVRPGLAIGGSCDCRHSEKSCTRAVIENVDSSTPRTFTVRRLAVSEAQLDLWDLSVFGLPEHPLFNHVKRVERLECDYLNLDFATVAERRKFNKHLRLLLKLRDEAEESFDRTIRRAAFFSDRPNHTSVAQQAASVTNPRAPAGPPYSGNSSQTNLSRVSTLPPSHRRISIASNFADSFHSALDPRYGTLLSPSA